MFYSYIWIVCHTTCGSLDPEVFPKLLGAGVCSRHRLRMLVPACQGDAEWKCKKPDRINSTNNRLPNQHADKRTCKTNFWKHCLIWEVLACGSTPNISYNDCGDDAMALWISLYALCMQPHHFFASAVTHYSSVEKEVTCVFFLFLKASGTCQIWVNKHFVSTCLHKQQTPYRTQPISCPNSNWAQKFQQLTAKYLKRSLLATKCKGLLSL